MDHELSPQLIVLARPGAGPDWFSEIAATRLPTLTRSLIVKEYHGEVREACRRIRHECGREPLGVVVADEAEGYCAIEEGADETVIEQTLSPMTAMAFMDRTLLRGRLRLEQEQFGLSDVHTEKLFALGTLVAGVAHEVNNPLTALLLSAEELKARVSSSGHVMSLLEDFSSERWAPTREELTRLFQSGRARSQMVETRELLCEVEEAAQAIARVVKDLKQFARPEEAAVPEILEVRPLLEQALRIVGRRLRNRALIELDYGANLPPVLAVSSRLIQVFTNILLNAAHAVAEVERPIHRIRISAQADEEVVAVSFSDTGPGIAPDVVSRVFDSFFTTRVHGGGTGLGLSISRSILRRLGGDLLVESVHGDGATFVALIPRADQDDIDEGQRRPLQNSQVCACALPNRVLIIDSDEHVLSAAARALDEQCDVLLVHDSEEAIDLLASGSHVDVILADVSRPERSGVALLDWLSARGSPLLDKVVLMTSDEDRFDDAVTYQCARLLRKPLSRSVLRAAIVEVLTPKERAIA